MTNVLLNLEWRETSPVQNRQSKVQTGISKFMQNFPPPSQQARSAILRQSRTFYAFFTPLFASLTIAFLAWHWHQPQPSALGFPYFWSIPILLIVSALGNGISFYFQDRYVRVLLQRPEIAAKFRLISFTLRFYLYSLITGIVLSALSIVPLIVLLFFHWIYPVSAWLMPYQLLIGVLIGWQIKLGLES